MGMPAFIMTAMSIIQAVVVYDALSRYGTIFNAAFYGAVFHIFSFLMMPVAGLMGALLILPSQA
jgi:Na+-driven multidrug efflux pump